MRWLKIFPSRERAMEAVAEGKARRVVIGDLKIALVRWKSEFYAIQDDCPHSSAHLSQGWVNTSGEVVCPLHGYCYNLNTGREFQQKSVDARTWPLKWQDNCLFIGLSS